jgi:phospholipase D1/2
LERTYDVDCYFPMHNNCRVTLYQDAHCVPGLPQFNSMERPDGKLHEPRSCWRDLYDTLIAANEVICITGWAVWDKLQLFRGQDLAIDGRTLGEILVDKANQGVRVYVMVWSEKTSGGFLGEKGFMGTHDMETFNYFNETKVTCAVTPRELGDVKELTDVLQNQFSSGAYTHHQKSVICDAPACIPGGSRRLVAFVGGLDLTGGRYDTPSHELFKTLLNEHDGDFRNSNAKMVSPHQGPREPWHDIHSFVEGIIAYDVFLNFEERWNQQGLKFGDLIKIHEMSVDINAPLDEDPGRLWNCQLFRSITSDSAVFDMNRIGSVSSLYSLL